MITRMMALLLVLAWPLVSQAAERDRAPRYYDIHINLYETGLVVAVPHEQNWTLTTLERPGPDAVVLNSPPQFYPTTTMQLQLHATRPLATAELRPAALGYANQVRRQLSLPLLGAEDELEPVTYNDIEGYADAFDQEVRGRTHAFKNVFGLMPSGEPVTLMVSTPEGQLAHIEHTVRDMWGMLRTHTATEKPTTEQRVPDTKEGPRHD